MEVGGVIGTQGVRAGVRSGQSLFGRNLHKTAFASQSGWKRINLFWRKKHILLSQPVHGAFFLLLKLIEYGLFLLGALYGRV